MSVTALAVLALAPGAFGAETNVVAVTKPPCCRAIEGTGVYTDRSLYQLESIWTSDVGKEIRLGVLQGRVQIAVMFFATCEFTCPITVHDLKSIQAAMPEALRDRVDFLLVTFDSERDTPAVLSAYREKMKLDPKYWTLLRGKSDDVRELAALLGINFKRDPRGQFAHTNLITVLNDKGEIIHQLPGMNHDAKAFVRDLEKLLSVTK